MVQQPVKLTEVLLLPSLGVNPDSLSFATCTLESDKYVCVLEAVGQSQPSVVIVDTENPKGVVRRSIVAEAAAMNPRSKIIALRAGSALQIVEFDTKRKLKSCVMSDPAIFIKWITERTLGLVTATAVYHWRIDDEHDPLKMFDRHRNLASAQITDYKVDRYGEWLALVGISPTEGGSVTGNVQLFSVKKKLSQALDANIAAFASLRIAGYDTTLFVFATRTADKYKLHVIEVETEKKPKTAPKFERQQCDLYCAPEMPGDFPLSMQVSSKYAIAYVVTKMGYLHIYDIEGAVCLYVNRICDTTMFVTSKHENSGGIVGITRKGQLLVAAVEPDAVIPYVMSKLRDVELATRLASRNGFKGAERLFSDQFRELFEDGDYEAAAIIASESPASSLRTRETIELFKSVRPSGAGPSPLMIYFNKLLERETLNQVETLELVLFCTGNGKAHLLEKWLKEEKLECTEEAGDVVYRVNPTIALAVYIKAKAHMRVIQCMIETGQTANVPTYAKKAGMNVEAMDLVQMASKISSQAALELANSMQQALVVLEKKPKSSVDHEAMFDMFLQKGLLQEATSYCLDNLEDDSEWGRLQTKCLSANLTNMPHVADAILQQDIWHYFEKFKIALLCERAGLLHHALENFTDLSDVKRVITNTHIINPNFILQYFGTLSPDAGLECLEEIIRVNPRGNLTLAVQIAAKYSDDMGPKNLMRIFSSIKQPNALFLYLGAIVNFSSDPEVHYSYIESSVKLEQYHETERVTRESNYYDPERVKNFLKDNNLKDPRPLINVCDRFGFVEEMVKFMVRGGKIKFVEGYVQKVNPTKCPVVVGSLLDLDVAEDRIKSLVMSVKNMVPVEELIDEVDKRGKLKILLQFLESKIADGSTEEGVHSGAAKVYVETNVNPEHFLRNNPYYDSRKVGKYCERRDPLLAFVAYERGKCDDDVLNVTNNNSLFREQASYVVDRENKDLWRKVLDEQNPFRNLFIDQVVSTALPKIKAPEKVAVAVQGFLEADMPEVLMEMLERLVMSTSNTAFSRNQNLQNLLILTSIRARPERVMEYIRRLDNYDGIEIARVCVGAGLGEEAYTIYYKFQEWEGAVGVLIDVVKDFGRAEAFAHKIAKPEVWSRLGIAMLKVGQVYDGVACLMRAKDPSEYLLAIEMVKEHGEDRDWGIVVKYLKTVRKRVKNYKVIDTEVVYGHCRLNQLGEVEEFLSLENETNIDDVGERCFDEERWVPAKMMLMMAKNWVLLAIVLVNLHEYKEAVGVARLANRVKTWKYVCFGCVDGREFRLAKQCGIHVVIEASELTEVLDHYQDRGHFQELIDLMDDSLSHDRAHQAMFTETGVLYTKYRQHQLFDFIKMWWQRFSIPRVIRACEAAWLWREAVFLFVQYKEYDNAAKAMMDHFADAWDHGEFVDVLTKVGALEVMYQAIQFYAQWVPEHLVDILIVLAPRCEATRAITILMHAHQDLFGNFGVLSVCKHFLRKVQEADIPEINSALNDILIEEENVEELHDSVDNFQNFDQFSLAKRLEKHKLIDMRQVSIKLFYRSGKYEHAIALSKREKLWKSAIDAASASEDPELIEELALYFLDNTLFECFTALLYTAYQSFPVDVAAELAWSRGKLPFFMPFMIQAVHEVGHRLMKLQQERVEDREREQRAKQQEEDEVNDDPSILLYGLGPEHMRNAPLMIGYHGPAADGGYMPATGGGFIPQIGWHPMNPSMQPPATAMYNTFAFPPQG